ncbi:MAG: alpha/beta hydrolase [Archangium gephyra]|uniref:Alpha/beta hydrolase n=1 Tax=Archangium gephyra TaxID=48 RepID=A0A2W5VXX5_9BACT|nr:MAG: alpha/beta hydrolase [Archangium gephyra]
MRRQVLFIQGGGEGAHDEWDNSLVEGLRRELGDGYEVRYPRMPDEADPKYVTWASAIEEEMSALDDGAIIVGHSIGGTVLINYLATRTRKKLGAVVLLAAPYIGKGGWPSEEIEGDRELGKSLPSELPIHLFHGDDDETAPEKHVDLYAKAIPQAVVHRVNGDHQLNNDMTEVARHIRALG